MERSPTLLANRKKPYSPCASGPALSEPMPDVPETQAARAAGQDGVSDDKGNPKGRKGNQGGAAEPPAEYRIELGIERQGRIGAPPRIDLVPAPAEIGSAELPRVKVRIRRPNAAEDRQSDGADLTRNPSKPRGS